MTDRELLEMAAKAAGYKLSLRLTDGGLMLRIGKKNSPKKWNPLTNDGDALRLAVKLTIDFYIGDDDGTATYAGYFIKSNTRQCFAIERHCDDPYAATRRAIVRAAAEIGKGMK